MRKVYIFIYILTSYDEETLAQSLYKMIISINMVWEKPQYNKLQVNEAGKMILTGTSSLEDLKQSFKVLNNWRGSHSYPMGKFQALHIIS